MTPAHLYGPLIFAAAVGALVGVVSAITIVGRWLEKITPKPEEFIRVNDIKLIVKVHDQDGSISATSQITTNYPELSAYIVQDWLDKRGLMMAPKGKDFAVRKGDSHARR